MRKVAWTLYLWPGLPAVWLDGSWTGLAVAVSCGAALNLLLLASWVWFELLTHAQLVGGWMFLGLFWLAAALVARRSRSWAAANPSQPAAGDLFQTAITEYLKGHWYDAEAAVTRLVAKNPKDVEARLLWATLLRRTRRTGEARAQLKQLERLDGAADWREEIGREWQALSELRSLVPAPLEQVSAAPPIQLDVAPAADAAAGAPAADVAAGVSAGSVVAANVLAPNGLAPNVMESVEPALVVAPAAGLVASPDGQWRAA